MFRSLVAIALTTAAAQRCDWCVGDCKKVYIDTDLGIDDNFALVSAFGEEHRGRLCIIGIGVTAGNVPKWISSQTFPKLLDLFEMDIPYSIPAVEEGKGGDLDKLYSDKTYSPPGGRPASEYIHGCDGMGCFSKYMRSTDTASPALASDLSPSDFMSAQLRKECSKDSKCSVSVIGPLGNIIHSTAAMTEEAGELISEMIWTGGSFVTPGPDVENVHEGIEYVDNLVPAYNYDLRRRGNVAPLSEFNAWFDAEAFGKLLEKKPDNLNFVMLTLDATNKVLWSAKLVDKFERETDTVDSTIWNNAEFRQHLVNTRIENQGWSRPKNELIKEIIYKKMEGMKADRAASNFHYEKTVEGRAQFIKDISTFSWASTIANGQINPGAIAELVADAVTIGYILDPTLFKSQTEDFRLVVESQIDTDSAAHEEIWNSPLANAMQRYKYADAHRFLHTNDQWGTFGAPTKHMKGAVYRASDDAHHRFFNSPLVQEKCKPRIVPGRATVVDDFQSKAALNKFMLEWFVNAVAKSTFSRQI